MVHFYAATLVHYYSALDTQALSLAEKLTVAKEQADEAMTRAERGEQTIRSILDTVTDAIISIDSNGIIESFNPAAQKIFGYTAFEAIGRNVSMIMPEPHRSHHDEYMKPFVNGEPARILGTVTEQIAVDKNGKEFPVDLSINALYIGDKLKFTGIIRNIAERKKAQEEIQRLAMTDPLTGLANRNQFIRRFEETLKLTGRTEKISALLMLDLDKFKPVNDTYGHQAGDELLIHVANTLTNLCRETDVVARLGGDEFSVLLVFPESEDGVCLTAERIIEELAKPVKVLEHTVQIGVSAGIAIIPRDGNEIHELIKIADDALYNAKNEGRNRFKLAGKRDNKA